MDDQGARKMKAIPTKLGRVMYRSRTEARWGLFLKLLGVEFDYEPDGFVMPSGECYLPDFYIHDFDAFLEVKPNSSKIIKAESYKFEEFAAQKEAKHYWIALGMPSCKRNNILLFDEGFDAKSTGFFNNEWHHYLAEDRRDERVYWMAFVDQNGIGGGFSIGGPGMPTDHDRFPLIHRTIEQAYRATKEHKFN